MSLQALLNNQTIEIDDHKRGAREIKNWDDPSIDIHIEKTTKYKIKGVLQDIIIKISINNQRPIVTFCSKNKNIEIPTKLRKEIMAAFSDIELLNRFIHDLIVVLKNYKSIFEDIEKVKIALKMISIHFDLKWTDVIIAKNISNVVKSYTAICNNKTDKQYFIRLEKHKITLGDL